MNVPLIAARAGLIGRHISLQDTHSRRKHALTVSPEEVTTMISQTMQ